MQEKLNYIHLDGMDLAGKTETSINIASTNNNCWDIRKSTLTSNNEIYNFTNNLYKTNVINTNTLGYLYLAALLYDIDNFSWPTKSTIQDSTIILRSIAYYTINQNPRILSAFEDLLPKHPIFDYSFILTASVDERLRRLEKRINSNQAISSGDLMVKENPEKFLSLEACLIDTGKKFFKSKVIDTTRLNPMQVSNLINLDLNTSIN